MRIVTTVEEAIRRHSARLSRSDMPEIEPPEPAVPEPVSTPADKASVQDEAQKVLESRVKVLLEQLQSLRVDPKAMQHMRTQGAGLPDTGLAEPDRAVELGGARAHLLHLLPAFSACIKCDSATVRGMLAAVIGQVAMALCLSRDLDSSGAGESQVEMEYWWWYLAFDVCSIESDSVIQILLSLIKIIY